MKKAKKILLWTGIGAGALIAVLLIIAACYVWITGSRLEKRLAALKAAGEPICLADLARKPVPPEQNGATYLQQAQSGMVAVTETVDSIKWDDEDNFKPDSSFGKVLETINAYPNVYPLLEKAAACPYFDFRLDFSLSPGKFLATYLDSSKFSPSRYSARYIAAWFNGLLLKGRYDEAVQAAIVLLKISRQSEKEPLLIKYLHATAVRGVALMLVNDVLQTGKISSRSRADLDKELSLNGSMEIFRHALKTDRAFSIDSFKELPWSLFSYQWQIGVLNLYDEFLNNSTHPYADWIDNNDIQEKKSNCFNTFAALLRPSLKGALTATYRTQAFIRALRIINALQEKAPPNSDKVPAMAQLGLPDDAGIDPYNGKPMIIKKLPQGWLVYSVGANLKDDGGKIDYYGENRLLDIGFGAKPAAKEPQENKPAQE